MIDRFLEGLRNRLVPHGVAVVTIKPGFVTTSMTAVMTKGGQMWATPQAFAQGIIAAMRKRREVLYLPWFLAPVHAADLTHSRADVQSHAAMTIRPVAFFDLDVTLTTGDCLRQFLGGSEAAELTRAGQRSAAPGIATMLRAQGIERLRWHQAHWHARVLVGASLDLYLAP